MDTKTCKQCLVSKSLSDYSKHSARKDGLQTVCTECNRANTKEHYYKNKEKRLAAIHARSIKLKMRLREIILEAKSVPCVDCRQTYSVYVMDFDHVRGTKKAKISTMVAQPCTVAKLLEEIAKCEVVCSNCHRERTFNRDGWNPDLA